MTFPFDKKMPNALREYKTVPLSPYTKRSATGWKADKWDGDWFAWNKKQEKDRAEFNNLSTAERGERGLKRPILAKEITGYGVLLENTDLLVIDVDVNHDNQHDGIKSFEKFLKDNNIEKPDTLTAKTANGGYHYYLKTGKLPENTVLKSGEAALGEEYPGIDLKVGSAYIIGPGTKVKNDKKDILEYKVEVDTEIAVAGDEIMKALVANRGSNGGKKKSKSNEPAAGNPDFILSYEEYITSQRLSDADKQELLDEAAETMRACKEGNNNRNDTLFRLSGGLSARKGIDAATVIDALEQPALDTGLEQAEVDATLIRAAEQGEATYKLSDDEYGPIVRKYPHLTDLDYEEWTDLSIAAFAAKQMDVRYLPDTDEWYSYLNVLGVWVATKAPNVAINQVLSDLKRDLQKRDFEDDAQIRKSIHTARMAEQVLKGLRGVVGIQVEATDFDANPFLICAKNGVIDAENEQLLPHDKKYLMTQRINIDYDKDADHPVVDIILNALPDDAQCWFELMMGQALLGKLFASQVNIILYGRAANGKSVLLNMLHATSGDYGAQPPANLLSVGADKFAMASVIGKRQAIIPELPATKLNGDAIKMMSGEPTISIRSIGKDWKTISNSASVFIATNVLPDVLQLDGGVLRRPLLVPFTKTFKKGVAGASTQYVEPDSRVEGAHEDEDILKAFLARRVRGASRWINLGEKQRKKAEENLPESIKQQTLKWRIEAEPLNEFIESEMVFSTEHAVSVRHAYAVYKRWAISDEVGMPKNGILKQTQFRNQITTVIDGLELADNKPKGFEVSASREYGATPLTDRQKYITGLAFPHSVNKAHTGTSPASREFTVDDDGYLDDLLDDSVLPMDEEYSMSEEELLNLDSF